MSPASTSPDWSVDEAAFSQSMSITALVRIGGVVQASGSLGAFVGTDVRGSTQSATPVPPGLGPYGGQQMFGMLIYANMQGETVSFKFADCLVKKEMGNFIISKFTLLV